MAQKIKIERLCKVMFNPVNDCFENFLNDASFGKYSKKYQSIIRDFFDSVIKNKLDDVNQIVGLLDIYLGQHDLSLSKRLINLMIKNFVFRDEKGSYLIGDYGNKRLLRETKVVWISDEQDKSEYIKKKYSDFYIID